MSNTAWRTHALPAPPGRQGGHQVGRLISSFFASVEKGLRGLQPPYLMARMVLAAVHLQPVMSEKQRVPHPTAINHQPARPARAFFRPKKGEAMPTTRPYLVRAGALTYTALATSSCAAIVQAIAQHGAMRVSARPLPKATA